MKIFKDNFIKKRHFYTAIYRIIIIVFFLSVLLTIFVSRGLPGGIRFFTTSSYSMSPYIQPHHLYAVINSKNGYSKGDVVAFYAKGNNGNETIVTHRIIEVSGNVYKTKGDANIYRDSNLLRPRLIIGKVGLRIPLVGIMVKFIKGTIGTYLLIYTLAIVIIIIEFIKLNTLLHEHKEI